MSEAYRLGGWGMYPTTFIGLVLLLAAVLYALHPERRRALLVISLGVTTFLVGCLGFISGLIRTLSVATSGEYPEPVGTVVAAGMGESLNNIGLALALMIFAGIITSVGVFRSGS